MSFVHASASAGSLKVKGSPSTKRVPRTVIKLQTALLMLGIGMFFSLAQSASSASCNADNCGANCNGLSCAAGCTGANCGANCIANSCAFKCSGDNCGANCTGNNCANTCNGAGCGANCTGTSCAGGCIGADCGANCDGDYCATSCSGDGCGAGCTGDLCDLNCKDSNNITKYAGGNCGNPIPCVPAKKFENRIQGCCREVGFGKGKDGDSHHDTVVVKVFRKVLQQKAMEKCKAACAENADCTAIEIFRKGKKKRGTRKQTFRCELHTAGINGASRRTKSCKKATCHIAQSVCLPPLDPCPSGYTYNSDTTMCDGDEE